MTWEAAQRDALAAGLCCCLGDTVGVPCAYCMGARSVKRTVKVRVKDSAAAIIAEDRAKWEAMEKEAMQAARSASRQHHAGESPECASANVGTTNESTTVAAASASRGSSPSTTQRIAPASSTAPQAPKKFKKRERRTKADMAKIRERDRWEAEKRRLLVTPAWLAEQAIDEELFLEEMRRDAED